MGYIDPHSSQQYGGLNLTDIERQEAIIERRLAEANALINAGRIAVEVEEIEDPASQSITSDMLLATKPTKSVETPEKDEEEKSTGKKRGRPKGSKDKTPRKKSKAK